MMARLPTGVALAYSALTHLALASLLSGGLVGCGEANMADQERSKTWDRSAFFPNRMTMRDPVSGTVPRDDSAKPVPQPATISAAMLAQGQERYATFCAPCHALNGDGRGPIVWRGFPAAPPLDEARLRQAKAADLYGVITHGKGVMYGFAQQIRPAERWAIVAYLRALQLSRGTDVASLPAEDQIKLGEIR